MREYKGYKNTHKGENKMGEAKLNIRDLQK